MSRSVTRAVRRQPRQRDFLRYVERVYIGPHASFRPPMWSVFDRRVDVRTINNVER